jgi:hypothetical protein
MAFWWRPGRRRGSADPADAGSCRPERSVLATLDPAGAAASLGVGSMDRITSAEAVAPGPGRGTDRFVEAFPAGDAPRRCACWAALPRGATPTARRADPGEGR